MFINIQLCQSTDINLKLALFWKGIAQFVIKPVDSLDHQDIIFSKLKLISPVFPVSGLKIKSRKIHFLSSKKIQHILIKLLDINGFQALKILFPEFIKRGMLPVHEAEWTTCGKNWSFLKKKDLRSLQTSHFLFSGSPRQWKKSSPREAPPGSASGSEHPLW